MDVASGEKGFAYLCYMTPTWMLVLSLISGLGVFLFGMYLLEDAVQGLVGGYFHRWIRRFTKGPIRGILTGALATAILQSSSAVTLMLLAFTGAGLIGLADAIGVVLGANLGTTMTTWLVALLGFKISIEGLAIPLAGLGGIGLLITGNNSVWHGIWKLFGGLGLVFLGIGHMKDGMEDLTVYFSPEQMMDWYSWRFVLAGFLLTLLVQSSSAAMALALSMLYSGLFSFEQACFLVIGTNIGTTVTVALGALGANRVKKQVAAAHFIFNFLTGLIVWLFLSTLGWSFLSIDEQALGPVNALALFHTLFNGFGILIFLPFIPWLAKILNRWFPENLKKDVLEELPASVPLAGVEAVVKEVELAHGAMGRWFKGEKVSSVPPLASLESLELRLSKYAATLRNSALAAPDAAALQSALLAMRALVSTSQLWTEAQHAIPSKPNALEESFTALFALVHKAASTVGQFHQKKDWTSLRHEVRQIDMDHFQKAYGTLEKHGISEKHQQSYAMVHRLIFQALLQWLRAGRDLQMARDQMKNQIDPPSH